MALQLTITTNSGITINKAYLKINEIQGDKNGIDIMVLTYVNKELADCNKDYVIQKIYHFIPAVDDEAVNIFKQGYEYLKTLDEFNDAVDC